MRYSGHAERSAGNGVCIDCGGEIALCLARLGSLRCHDCRDDAAARMALAPAGQTSGRFRAFVQARATALARLRR